MSWILQLECRRQHRCLFVGWSEFIRNALHSGGAQKVDFLGTCLGGGRLGLSPLARTCLKRRRAEHYGGSRAKQGHTHTMSLRFCHSVIHISKIRRQGFAGTPPSEMPWLQTRASHIRLIASPNIGLSRYQSYFLICSFALA